MIMTNNTSKRTQAILENLFSTKRDIVQAALKKIPSQGNAGMIIPLLKTYVSWESDEDIQNEIAKILAQLKTESAVPELVEALEDPEFDAIRALILSSFWHSGIYPISDLDVLVRHAIRGDFFVTLEAITVIENIEAAMDVEMIQDGMFDIDEFLDEHPDEPHSELLAQLKNLLTTLYNQ